MHPAGQVFELVKGKNVSQLVDAPVLLMFLRPLTVLKIGLEKGCKGLEKGNIKNVSECFKIKGSKKYDW